MSIVDYGTYSPSIDTKYFLGTNASAYWSSTTLGNPSSNAWRVTFGSDGASGGVYMYDKSNYYYVRCVRGGQ